MEKREIARMRARSSERGRRRDSVGEDGAKSEN